MTICKAISSEVVLELSRISMNFSGVRALSGVDFELRRGEVHALCGENGAGKSTLVKIICGYYSSKSFGGQMRFQGASAEFRNLRAAEQRGIALIAQELALVPGLSVAENLMLGHEPLRRGLIDWPKVRQLAHTALEKVGLDIDPECKVELLGIGQQQMVEIAKALLKNVQVLVLDEPTAALADKDVERLLSLIVDLTERGISCVYISHRLEEVFQIAHRITVLRDGRSIITQPVSELTIESTVAYMVGRELKTLYHRPAKPSTVPVLQVRNWTVEHPHHVGRFALKDVSFDVHQGEVVGVGGLMGAGRTALVSTIFGVSQSRVSGQLILAGRTDTSPFGSPRAAIAGGVALVSEDRKRYGLNLEASLLENITMVTLRRFVRHGLIREKVRMESAQREFEALRIRAPGLMALARNLSGGNQQKVVLAAWLLAKPRILLLDEPTRGIDVGAKAEIYRLISILAESGMAIVLVSSDLPELLGMSHRVLVLNQGHNSAWLDHDQATPARVISAATQKVMAC